jgi:hypothetical protein
MGTTSTGSAQPTSRVSFRRGVDPVTIMQYAGHAYLETTLKYARPAAAEDRIAAVSGIDWEGNA